MQYRTHPLYLPEAEYRFLFNVFGPSLGLWRAAEIAALREQTYEPPVLDLGCGDGLVTSRVLPRVDAGLDPDLDALQKASRLGVYARFIPLTMEEAGLPPSSLSTVISNSVIEHIPPVDSALAAAAQALKPGGRFIITAPTEAFSRWLTLPTASYAARRNRHFQHLNLWPVEEWQRHLMAVGLEIECVRPYLSQAWVRAWDMVELFQMIYIGKKRLFGRVWKRLPPAWTDALARRAARVDLSAPPPGGGRMIVARKQ